MQDTNIKNKVDTFNKEYEYIKSDKYKKCAKELINTLPDYFFEVAASSTGKYHPSFTLGYGGLVRHTKVAVRIAHELLENNSLGHKFTNDEKDLIIISLLIHDGFKHGTTKQKYVQFDHPLIVAKFLKDNKSKFDFTDKEIDFIINVVSSHMGEWNTNNYSNVILPLPVNKYQRFVHMCDFLASRKFLDVKFENNDITD